jgi:hypothetical protein
MSIKDIRRNRGAGLRSGILEIDQKWSIVYTALVENRLHLQKGPNMSIEASGILPRNPYSQMTALHKPEMFFGRKDSLEHLCYSIMDGQSVAVIGSRRIGKSSLLTCLCLPEIQQRVKCLLDRHLLVLLDLEEHLQKTPDDFFALICEQLLHQSQGILQFSAPQGSEGDRFSQLLSQIKAQGYHPVLLLDEFDSILRNVLFNPDFFSFMRAQANAGKVSYITASLASLDQICHSDIVGSPFFNIFSHHYLGPLTREAAIELIAGPAKVAGYPFTEAEVQFVLNVAGCHPFFLQRTCYFLFQYKSQFAHRIDQKHITKLVYTELQPHFIYAWEHLPAEQHEQMKKEAIRQGAYLRKIPELSESALFRKYVRATTKITSYNLTVEYLRDILSRLDDLKFLGESDLSNLNLILTQEDIETFTPLEKGIRIHKLLQDAHAQLRPASSHENTSPEWQTYYLLNNTFFKRDRRTNKQLAGYMGMSERDFYRKRDDAVRVLLAVILKMEALCTAELGV